MTERPMQTSGCPHANHFGKTVPHAELRQICTVCGGPRIHAGAQTRGGEVDALRAAKEAYTRRTSWRFGAGCSAALATFGTIIGLALLRLDSGWATTMAVVFLGLAAPFALVFMTGLGRIASYSKKMRASVETAWSRALRDTVLGATQPMLASTLAQQLGATEDEADRWLAELSAEGLLRSEVTDEGQIVYLPATRMRIAAPGSPGASPDMATSDPLSSDAELEARFADLARRESQPKP